MSLEPHLQISRGRPLRQWQDRGMPARDAQPQRSEIARGEPHGVVYFYRTADAYGAFSNFSRHSVEIDGRTWPTTEHYFQAQKFLDADIQARIAALDSPMEAAQAGRDRLLPLRTDWEEVKDQIMRTAVWAKVRQHRVVRELLLGTGSAAIVEHTTNDAYWGDGGDGSGQNMLGVILMEVREALRRGPDT
jgi:ribA/ribD-fused uncharacterized protein